MTIDFSTSCVEAYNDKKYLPRTQFVLIYRAFGRHMTEYSEYLLTIWKISEPSSKSTIPKNSLFVNIGENLNELATTRYSSYTAWQMAQRLEGAMAVNITTNE